MKKILLVLTVLTAFLASCTTTKPIKADELENTNFTLKRIVLTSSTIKPSDEELIQIFKSFPYEEICDSVFDKNGIYIDTYYLDYDSIESNIEYTVVCDAETEEILEELPEWELNLDVDPEEDNDDQFCEFIFNMEPPDGYLSVKVMMYTTKTIPATKEGKEDKTVNLKSTVYQTFEKWTFKNIFVDPRSCAQIKFQKNLYPTFIQNELYSVYSVLNMSDDGYLNLNVKEPVEIRCNIDDPGNMFFSPAQIYNASFTETFQPGKKYLLKYKLKRRSPDSANWIVVFKLKEEKPKQSK